MASCIRGGKENLFRVVTDMNYRKGFGLFLSITFVFLVASLSDAAEFSADMTIQSATGGDLTGRVFVKGNDLRQELDTPVGTQTTIID